jgi:predicted transcriptional regulator
MSEASLSIRVPEKTKNKLDSLAKASGQSRSALASVAIEVFVEREAKIRRGIEKACKELDAGLGIPHEAAMRRLKDTIGKSRANRNR